MALRLSEHDPRPFETALGQVIFELDGVFQSLYVDRNQSSLLSSLSLEDMPVTQRSVEDRQFVLSFVSFAQDAVKTIVDTKEWIACDFWLWDSDSSERTVLLSTGIAGFTLIIVFNVLIILAFIFRRRELLVPQNYYILALSLSDLVGIGCCALPQRLSQDVQGCFPFSSVICRIVSIMSWIGVQTSAWTVILLAWDRYLMLALRSRYAAQQNQRRVLSKILLVFLVQLAIWIPANCVDFLSGRSLYRSGECPSQFLQYPFLSVILIGWAYVVPPIVLTCIYALVVIALYRRRRPTKLLYKNASRHPLADVDDISFDGRTINLLHHPEVQAPSEEGNIVAQHESSSPSYNTISTSCDKGEPGDTLSSSKSGPAPNGCPPIGDKDRRHHSSRQLLHSESQTFAPPHLNIWMTPEYFRTKKVPLQRQSVSVTDSSPSQLLLSTSRAPALLRTSSKRKFSYAPSRTEYRHEADASNSRNGKYHGSIKPDPVTVTGHLTTSNNNDGEVYGDAQTTRALLQRFKAAFLRSDANTRRAVRSVIVLCTIFLLLWLSTGILSPPIIWCYYYAPADACDLRLMYKLVVIASYVLYLTALLNPVMYALAFPKIRAAVLHIILPKRIYYRLPEHCLGRREERMRKRIMSHQFSVKRKPKGTRRASALKKYCNTDHHVYPGAATYDEEDDEEQRQGNSSGARKNGLLLRRNSLFSKPSPLTVPGLPTIEVHEPPNTVPLTERRLHDGSRRDSTCIYRQLPKNEIVGGSGSSRNIPHDCRQAKRISLPTSSSISLVPNCAANHLHLSSDHNGLRSGQDGVAHAAHEVIVEANDESDETAV